MSHERDDGDHDGDGDAEPADDGHGYRHVRVEDLPDGRSPAPGKKEVDEAVGATAFGFNVYEAGPGDLLPWGRHRHPDHEELFYVLAGRLVVDTDDGDYDVGPGEALFVPRDHPNAARAAPDADEPTRVVAVGAPKDADRSVIEEYCPDCDAVTGRDADVRSGDDGGDGEGESPADGRTVVLTCAACGAETRRF